MDVITETDVQQNVGAVCKYCGKSYRAPGHLKNHEENNCTKKKIKEESDTSEDNSGLLIRKQRKRNKGNYSCNNCGFQFKYKKVLEKHVAIHSGRYPFWCKLCMQNFSTKEERIEHKLQEHPKKKPKKLSCKLCNTNNFASEEEYLHHITELHEGRDNELSICSECGKYFKTKSELTQHNRSKCSTVRQFKCAVCNQELMTPGSLYNHMRRHTGERSFMCGYCGKQFVTLGQLQVHVRIHTQDKAFKCNVCDKGFCHRQSLLTHSTIHTGIKPYQCENCSKAFSCIGNLLKHRRTHSDSCGLVPLTAHRVINPSTKIKVRINTPDSSRLKTFNKQKEIEKKVSAYKKSLELKSKNIEDTPQPIKEEIVTRESLEEGTSNTVETHNLAKGSNDPQPKLENIYEDNPVKVEDEDFYNDMQKGPTLRSKAQKRQVELLPDCTVQENFVKQDAFPEAKCKYCGKSYSNVRWLTKHEQQHLNNGTEMGDNQYKCSCCKIGFKMKEELKIHQENTHSDVLTCEDCDKIFSNVDSLRSHQNVYHRGLPKKIYTYICEKCGFQFRQKAALEQHEQTKCGTGSCGYQCNICGKTCSSIYTLKTHLSVHDPKKKFLCKFCGKNFRWKGQLKIHERSHTGEKPFKCLYCPKAFPYRESLLTHSSIHTGIKPHLCQACGSRFSCIGNLIKHRLTHASTCGTWFSKNQGSF